jgi:hypothetical protein
MKKTEKRDSLNVSRELTESERSITVENVIDSINKHHLENDPASQQLLGMLMDYVKTGNTYIDQEIKLDVRHARKYIINLYNRKSKPDTVLIRMIQD